MTNQFFFNKLPQHFFSNGSATFLRRLTLGLNFLEWVSSAFDPPPSETLSDIKNKPLTKSFVHKVFEEMR